MATTLGDDSTYSGSWRVGLAWLDPSSVVQCWKTARQHLWFVGLSAVTSCEGKQPGEVNSWQWFGY